MKQLLVGVIVYCFSLLLAEAQQRSNEKYILDWNKGTILFKSGDSLHCDLRYNHTASTGVLQILEGNIAVTLSPRDVNTFSFYDEQRQRIRKFTSLEIVNDGDVSRPFFMENLYSDHRFSIVNHRTMDVPYEYMNYTRMITKPVKVSKKYILDTSTKKLFPLSKENALRLMDKKREEIMSFIQSHHLKFKKTADYIHLFQYHSSL